MAVENGEGGVKMVEVARIRQNPVALREVKKDLVAYQELADSVRKNGILNSILVQEEPDPENPGQTVFGLIDGLQRYNVALDLGLKSVPARITTADQGQKEILQMVANIQKIETKPIELARQCERILERNPTMSMEELANLISKGTDYLYKIFGLKRNLHEELQPKLDKKEIPAANCYELSKLPKEEQLDWLARALTMKTGEFTAAVSNRVKEIKDAKRKGKAAPPEQWVPVPVLRALKEIQSELTGNVIGPQIVARKKITDPATAFNAGIAWALQMDDDSIVRQKAEHDAREKVKDEEKEKKQLERAEQKKREAEATAEELKKKLLERANAPVVATA